MGEEKEYPGNLTPYAIITCVIAATGGLTFGYDIGISGISFLMYISYFFEGLGFFTLND